MKVLICGGGTAGHVYPGLALAEALKATEPGTEIIFVGSENGLENQVVPAAGYELRSLPIRGLPRRPSAQLFSFVLGLAQSLRMATSLIRDYRPGVVVGMGGFASFPAVAAARWLRCPIILHEQNAVPGMANRWLGRWADAVALTFADPHRRLRGRRVVVVGNPVRKSLLLSDRDTALKKLGLEDRPVTLLVFGGSRGARRLNEAVIGAYDMFRHAKNLQVMHVTGMMEHERFKQQLEAVKRRHDTVNYRLFPYIEDMGAAYAAADLVCSRAGATTVAEITAVGLPSILVPYPHATDDHQQANAAYLSEAGAAKIIKNESLSPELFWQVVSGFAYRPEALKEMGAAAAKLGNRNAAVDLAGLVLEIAVEARGRKREDFDGVKIRANR